MISFLELIERVEATTGPDRELDAEIALALGLAPTEATWSSDLLNWKEAAKTEKGNDYTKLHCIRPNAYTSSLDAAVTLVPDGFRFNCGNTDGCWAAVGRPGRNFVEEAVEGEGATIALALTAACLRALGEQANREGEKR